MNLVLNSLWTSAAATMAAVIFGASSALLNLCLPRPWRYLLISLAIVALAMPPFLVTNCWLHYLGQTGVWHSWLPVNIFSLGGDVWLLALLTWPISFLLVDSAWRRLEPAMLEADPVLAGRHLLSMLLLPLARPALSQGAVLTFILALNNFAVPAILQVKVAPAEAWIRFNTEFDTLGALRMSWINIVVPLALLVWLSNKRVSWPKLSITANPAFVREQIGRAWFLLSAVLGGMAVALSVGLPVFQLISVKRTWTELPGAVAAGTTAIVNSLLYSAGGATLIVLLATVARLLLVRQAIPQINPRALAPWARLTSALLWTPFLIPGVVLGIGLIAAFNHDWSNLFYQSSAIVFTAYTIRYFAPGWAAIGRAWQAADPAVMEAAMVEGASRCQTFRYAVWPQIAAAVAAGWYVVFLLCLWDVEALILVVPPGGETLSLRIFNFLHYGHNAQVNALCLVLLVAALVPLLLAGLALRARRFFRERSPLAGALPPATGVRCTFALTIALAVLTLTGCRRHYRANEAPLDSAIFSSVQIIGTRGVGVGQLNKPRSVAVDKQDNLYVIDMTGRVQKFSPEGKFLLSWQLPQTELGKPKGMTRDLAGNIVVLEPHYQRVNHFSAQGKLVAQWGHRGTNEGQFMLPRAVAINSRNEAFVSEYSSMERVQKFELGPELGPAGVPAQASGAKPVTGRLLLAFGKPGNAPGEFNRPEGLFVDKQDRLYVADSCNHRIQIFSGDGKFIATYGQAGKGPGEFSYPYDICVDAEGNQYVCEFGNSRLQIFDPAHRPIEIIGKPGSEPGDFNDPWGLALDSKGNLYVADSQNHRVQKLIRRKPLLAKF